ncbi:MAG: Spy/CpxP family protein refolding chaperone [Candidatus Sulfotelmatobacter sp.]|jgi:Spy/CpxP family protein refolding chaperone
MKSFRFRLLIAAMAVLLVSAIAKSQTASDAPPPPPMHSHGYGMEGHQMGFFSKALNLTDEQKAQMKTIMQKEHPAMKPLMQQQRQIDLQLRQYVEGTFDPAKVQALASQKAQVQVQVTVAETRIHNELYQLLTTDQRTQLKEMEANHAARMQRRMPEAPPAPPSE